MTSRNISCRLDDDQVVIDLRGDGKSEMLFLTKAEPISLVEALEAEVIGEVGDEVIVADVRLEKSEGWQLVIVMGRVLGPLEIADSGGWKAVNWRVEGF